MDDKTSKLWEKAREAISFRQSTQDTAWKELDAFDRGEQWTTKGSMPSWIPRPSTNYISKVKKFKTGNLILDDYLGELKPLSPEDEPKIWMLQRFYEQLWDKLNVRYHILDVIRTSRLLGSGILYVGWDEAYIGGTHGHLYQGEIHIQPIEPSTFFVDPTAFDLQDANYCGTYIRTTEQAIMTDPSIEDKHKKKFEQERKFNTNTGDQESRGEIYHNRDYASYQEDVVDLVTMYEKVPSEDEGGFTIKVTYMADGVIIKEIEELKPNIFPFIKLDQYPQRQDFWGVSDAKLILPNVKMINKVQSVLGTLATLYQNPQKIVSEASGIDPRIVSRYGNAFGITYLSKHPDLKNVIQNVETKDIPPVLLDYIQFLKEDIDDFTGLTDIATGQKSGSVQTAGGIDSMIQRSLVSEQDEILVFERFLEKVSYALLLNAVEYYQDDRVMRLRSEKPNEEFEYEYVPFNSQEFEDIMWDFSIDIVKKIKNNQETKQEVMQMLSEWQLQYAPEVPIVTPEDIVKAFNPNDRDVILNRIKEEREKRSYEQAAEITQEVITALGQEGYSEEMIAELVFMKLNPEMAEEDDETKHTGDVHKRQEGL